MIIGPSGIGKTTLAKKISEITGIPFISGSYSELVPSTKEVLHEDMIKKNPQTIIKEDNELFTKRCQLYQSNKDFVSDRSFIDNIAYFINKLSYQIDSVDTDAFIDSCIEATNRYATHLIFIPFRVEMMEEFKIEDNSKRILNPWYQLQISSIMTTVITQCFNKRFMTTDDYKSMISKEDDSANVLVLLSTNFDERLQIALNFLGWKEK